MSLLDLTPKFQEFEKISPKAFQKKILAAVTSLGENPRPKGEPKIKPPIEVYNYIAQYRLVVADRRVLYDVDDRTKTVWIYAIRKRNERTYRY